MSSHKTFAEQAPGATGVDPNHPAETGYRVSVVDGPNGVVKAPDPARKKIAVCGFAASSRNLAPFDDPEWEVWGLNQLYRHVPRATRWFDIHANWREDNVPGTDHPAWLQQCGIPVYMSGHEPSVPTSVQYPLARVIERVAGVDYFTSTVAFMVAAAIYEFDRQVDAEVEELGRRAAGEPGTPIPEPGAEGRVVLGVVDDTFPHNGRGGVDTDAARRILLDPALFRRWLAGRYGVRELGIFGIDLIVGTEYDWQKSCVEYLLGVAHARGVTVRLPEQCALLKQRWRYGYETEPNGGLLRMTELRKRAEALTTRRNALIAELQTIDGALQESGYWQQVMDLRSKGGRVVLNEDT